MTDASRIAELMRRLETLEADYVDIKAREEIRELFNLYCFTADCGDAKGYSQVWAEDAVYESQRGRMAGREAFRMGIEDPDGIHKREIEGKGSLHTTGPLTIRVDGGKAWAEGHTLVWVGQDSGGYRIYTLSYNHWDLERRNERWEIVRRISRPVAPGHADKVFTGWRTAHEARLWRS